MYWTIKYDVSDFSEGSKFISLTFLNRTPRLANPEIVGQSCSMKAMKSIRITFLIGTLLLSPCAQAELIFERTFSSGYSSNEPDGDPNSANMALVIQPLLNKGIFSSILITPDSVGQTYTINSQTDPLFDSFVEEITNGEFDNDSRIYVTLEIPVGGSGSAMGLLEPHFFWNDFTGSNGVDLVGNTVDSISMRIDRWDTPGVAGDFGHTWDIAWTATFQFHGTQVPEPATGMLIVIGLLCAVLQRRFSRKRH